jgi:hypothetical protein
MTVFGLPPNFPLRRDAAAFASLVRFPRSDIAALIVSVSFIPLTMPADGFSVKHEF